MSDLVAKLRQEAVAANGETAFYEELLPAIMNYDDTRMLWEAAARIEALEAENERLRYHRKRLDARIHNQRKALRVNWQIAEERAGYRPSQSMEVRSRLLAIACRSDAKARALEAEVQRLREALAGVVYEVTSLSPMEIDGSHKCTISESALRRARAHLERHNNE